MQYAQEKKNEMKWNEIKWNKINKIKCYCQRNKETIISEETWKNSSKNMTVLHKCTAGLTLGVETISNKGQCWEMKKCI